MVAPAHEAPPEFATDVRRTDPRLRSDVQQAVAQLEYADELEIVRSLTQPIAVMHGSADELVNGAYLERLRLPTCGAARSSGSMAHCAQLERPEAFDALPEAFAQNCS